MHPLNVGFVNYGNIERQNKILVAVAKRLSRYFPVGLTELNIMNPRLNIDMPSPIGVADYLLLHTPYARFNELSDLDRTRFPRKKNIAFAPFLPDVDSLDAKLGHEAGYGCAHRFIFERFSNEAGMTDKESRESVSEGLFLWDQFYGDFIEQNPDMKVLLVGAASGYLPEAAGVAANAYLGVGVLDTSKESDKYMAMVSKRILQWLERDNNDTSSVVIDLASRTEARQRAISKEGEERRYFLPIKPQESVRHASRNVENAILQHVLPYYMAHQKTKD